MSETPELLPSPREQKPAGKSRRAVKIFLGVLFVLLGGTVGFFLLMRPFADRTARADAFGAHLKAGQSLDEVFSGPGGWTAFWADCTGAHQQTSSVNVFNRDGGYTVGRGANEITLVYPSLDAVLADLMAAKGPFAGLTTVHFSFKYFQVSRVYDLTIEPGGKVAKIAVRHFD